MNERQEAYLAALMEAEALSAKLDEARSRQFDLGADLSPMEREEIAAKLRRLLTNVERGS